MSLLLKALKQAEQGSDKPAASDNNLDLDPVDTPFAVRREWVQPNDNETDPGLPPKRPTARLSLPRLGLVPATALIALLVAIGYGIYVYLSINRPGLLAIPAAGPQPARIVQPAPSARPILSPMIAPAEISAAPSPVAPEAEFPRVPRAPATPIPDTGVAASHSHPAARAHTLASLPQQVPPALQATTPPAELEAAYQAYQAGHLEEARIIYSRVVSRDRSTDALLGLAAIAMVQDRPAESIRFYRQVLEIDPRNAIAQAALLDTLGTSDSAAAESQLKTQIQQAPSAYLYYALGNLYADQKRWSDAEAAYFEAAKREPANGDYTFNLAVSLDHLEQPDAALRHYESAIKLATPDSRFKRSQAETRIQELRGR